MKRVLLGALTATLLVVLQASGAVAQDLFQTLTDPTLSDRVVQVLVAITVLSLVPGLAITITCFPFIVTVLAILRQGIGLQQSPPNMLIVSLAVFLTWFVMEPTIMASYSDGVLPLQSGRIGFSEALPRIIEPFRIFMLGRADDRTIQELFLLRSSVEQTSNEGLPLSILVPSFLLSEMQRAFEVGFLIFIPFLVIDLVVAAILMSMGMMMVPPAIVSLPFKLAFFVVSDGWALVSGALVQSYF